MKRLIALLLTASLLLSCCLAEDALPEDGLLDDLMRDIEISAELEKASTLDVSPLASFGLKASDLIRSEGSYYRLIASEDHARLAAAGLALPLAQAFGLDLGSDTARIDIGTPSSAYARFSDYINTNMVQIVLYDTSLSFIYRVYWTPGETSASALRDDANADYYTRYLGGMYGHVRNFGNGYTRGDLSAYYEQIVSRMAPEEQPDAEPERFAVGNVEWEISRDRQSIYLNRPRVSGCDNYSIAYNIYDSASNPVNYFYSLEDRVAATPGYGGLFNVFVVVTNLSTGEENVQNIGWQTLSWPYANRLAVGQVSYEISPDRQSIYLTRPSIACKGGSVTIAYNIYDSQSNPVNYFYSADTRVAASPGYAGKFNVFVVVTDTVTGETNTQNIGWQILGEDDVSWPVLIDGVYYDLVDGEVTVTGGLDRLNGVTIQAYVAGRPVTRIANEAFRYNKGISGQLVIPDTIKSIGHRAFYEKWFSGSLVIPDSVTSIGDEAFSHCFFDGSLTIGSGVRTIGEWAFYECRYFTGNLTFGSNVSSIGQYAFAGCTGFQGSLRLPVGLKTLGKSAFEGCSGFNGTLTLSFQMTEIPAKAFHQCSGLTGGLRIPSSVKSIGEWAFGDCAGLNGTLQLMNNLETIYDNAFKGCSHLRGQLTIPDSVTSIGSWAFWQCSGFTGTLKLGKKATAIGMYAFADCAGLTGRLTIPAGTPYIKNWCFENCTGLTSVSLPPSVERIGNGAFRNCSSLSGEVHVSSYCHVEGDAFSGTQVTLIRD